MQSYLEKDLVERLGIQNEVFESGSFTFREEEMVQAASTKASEDVDLGRKELERGQVVIVNPDTDSIILNSDAEQSQSSFAAAQQEYPAGSGVQETRDEERKNEDLDDLPQVEETKEDLNAKREKDASEIDEGDVSEDSFRSANMSITPEEVSTKIAAKLPETRAKAGISQISQLKVVGRRMPVNQV